MTVTAVTNGTPTGYPAGKYAMHATSGQDLVVLGFSPVVPGIELATTNHGDAGGTETFTITGETSDSVELFTTSIVDENTTVLRPDSGAFVPGLAKLTVAFTGPSGSASLISFRILTC